MKSISFTTCTTAKPSFHIVILMAMMLFSVFSSTTYGQNNNQINATDPVGIGTVPLYPMPWYPLHIYSDGTKFGNKPTILIQSGPDALAPGSKGFVWLYTASNRNSNPDLMTNVGNYGTYLQPPASGTSDFLITAGRGTGSLVLNTMNGTPGVAIKFATAPVTGGSDFERMSILHNGNINIGTATPTPIYTDLNGFLRIRTLNKDSNKTTDSYCGLVFADSIGNLRRTSMSSISGWGMSGNSITSGQWLGTTNSQDLVLKAKSYEYLRLDQAGGDKKIRIGNVPLLFDSNLVFKSTTINPILTMYSATGLIEANNQVRMLGNVSIGSSISPDTGYALYVNGLVRMNTVSGGTATPKIVVADQNGKIGKSTVSPDSLWAMGGNTGSATSNKIGTTGNNPFSIITNNTERLKIYNNGLIEAYPQYRMLGNVSIGSSISPDTNYALYVNGNVRLNTLSGGTSTPKIVLADQNGKLSKSSSVSPDSLWAMGGNPGNATSNKIGTTGNNPFSIITNNTERIKVYNNGDVKISDLSGGSSSPQIVVADQTGILSKSSSPIQVDSIWVNGGNPGNATSNKIGTTGNNPLSIITNNTERLKIYGSGLIESNSQISMLSNVSIGSTVSPDTNYALNVGGNVRITGLLGGTSYPQLVSSDQYGKLILSDININNVWLNGGNSDTSAIAGRFGFKTSHALSIITNNIDRMTFKENGYIGIGSSEPKDVLQIGPLTTFNSGMNNSSQQTLSFNAYFDSGSSVYNNIIANRPSLQIGIDDISVDDSQEGAFITIDKKSTTPAEVFAGYNSSSIFKGIKLLPNGNIGIGTNAPQSNLAVKQIASYMTPFSVISCNNQPFLKIDTLGNLGIGTINPSAKLEVAGNEIINGNSTMFGDLKLHGTMYALEVLIKDPDEWPDYVFKSNYPLRSISETEKFIRTNGHLPDVPSEEEIKKDGIKMSEMQALMMKKIEELTLYVISLKKENEALKEKVDNLSK